MERAFGHARLESKLCVQRGVFSRQVSPALKQEFGHGHCQCPKRRRASVDALHAARICVVEGLETCEDDVSSNGLVLGFLNWVILCVLAAVYTDTMSVSLGLLFGALCKLLRALPQFCGLLHVNDGIAQQEREVCHRHPP